MVVVLLGLVAVAPSAPVVAVPVAVVAVPVLPPERRYPMKGVKGAAQQPSWLSSKSRRSWDRLESTIHCLARMDPPICSIALICHPLSLYSSIPS